jgi:parallel beta-helix repeat protein
MKKGVYKKVIVLGIILLFVGAGVIPSTGTRVKEKSFYLISNGNILYVGGNGPGNYSKIQDAIDNSTHGDTVFVYDDSSPYFEQVEISKPLSLIGENKYTTVIDGSNNWIIIYIRTTQVTVSGFTIRNSHKFSHAIYLRQQSNHNIITDNIITNNGDGIHSDWYTHSNTISYNTITSNEGYAIDLDESSNNIVIGNNLSYNFGGIHVYPNSDDNKLTDNIISNNDFGISIGYSSRNNITDNTINSNKLYGIHIWTASNNNTIKGNTINSNKGDGIYLENKKLFSDNNIITGNDICSNYMYGINITWSSKNVISENNFIDNNKYAYFSDCKNIWKHNYWGKPRILPKPIFGIIKIDFYWILWFNIDWRPALKPYDK